MPREQPGHQAYKHHDVGEPDAIGLRLRAWSGLGKLRDHGENAVEVHLRDECISLAGPRAMRGHLVGRRDHQDAHPRPALPQKAGSFDTAEDGHLDVEDGDVRVMPVSDLERLLAVARQPDYLEAAVDFHCGGKRTPEAGVVVGEEHADTVCAHHEITMTLSVPTGKHFEPLTRPS